MAIIKLSILIGVVHIYICVKNNQNRKKINKKMSNCKLICFHINLIFYILASICETFCQSLSFFNAPTDEVFLVWLENSYIEIQQFVLPLTIIKMFHFLNSFSWCSGLTCIVVVLVSSLLVFWLCLYYSIIQPFNF